MSSVQNIRALLVCFLVSLLTPCANGEPATTVLNRSILSVEENVYSLFDVNVILKMWNITYPSEAVKPTTDWKTTSGYFIDKRKGFLRNYEHWPTDVQRLLYITMTWPELRRLEIFVPDSKEKLALVEAIRKVDDWPTDDPIRGYLKTTPDTRLLELADMVLRAHSSEKSRGGMRESAGTITWFWHQAPLGPSEGKGNKEAK